MKILRSICSIPILTLLVSGCADHKPETCTITDNRQIPRELQGSRSQLAFDIIQTEKQASISRTHIIHPMATCEFLGGDVSGVIRYQDKFYDANGFTGATQTNPVRNTTVELLDCAGMVLPGTRTSTDDTGSFSISGAPAASSLAIYSESAINNQPISVYSLADAIYRFDESLPASATGLNIEISSLQYAGAFNILDVMQSTREYASNMMVFPNYPLDVYWTQGNSSTNSTFFAEDISDADTGQILVLSGNPATQDTDEFDDDVLRHEFGHFVEFALGQYDAVTSSHALNINTQNIDLAWSEGFANYIAIASKYWLVDQGSTSVSHVTIPTSWYMDTVGTSSNRLSFDFGTLDYSYCADGDCYAHTTSETATAHALWNMNQDVSIGETPIWQTFVDMSSTPAYLDTRMYPASFEIFFDAATANMSSADLKPILDERLINYAEDLYDQAGDDGSLTTENVLTLCSDLNCAGQQHTLYRADSPLNEDVDFFEVSLEQGKSYQFETFSLINGADTELALFDANGIMQTAYNEDLCSETSELNDIGIIRKNDGDALSSRLVFEATESGTFYLKVSSHSFSNTSHWYGAGRYGGYSIRGFELP